MKLLKLLNLFIYLSISQFVFSQNYNTNQVYTVDINKNNKFGMEIPTPKMHKTWEFSINLEELRKLDFHHILPKQSYQFSQVSSFNFQEQIPANINKIWIYGNSLKRSQDVNMLFYGDFSDKEIIKIIQDKIFSINQKKQLDRLKDRVINGNNVSVFIENKKQKKRYAVRLADNSFLFSTNIRMVRDYLTHPISENLPTPPIKDTDLFTFKMDQRTTKQNIQLNPSINGNNPFQSKLFNNIRYLKTKAHVENTSIVLSSLFSSINKEKGEQVESLLKGISALEILKQNSDSSIKSQVLRNLKIERTKKDVIAKSKFNILEIQNE